MPLGLVTLPPSLVSLPVIIIHLPCFSTQKVADSHTGLTTSLSQNDAETTSHEYTKIEKT